MIWTPQNCHRILALCTRTNMFICKKCVFVCVCPHACEHHGFLFMFLYAWTMYMCACGIFVYVWMHTPVCEMHTNMDLHVNIWICIGKCVCVSARGWMCKSVNGTLPTRDLSHPSSSQRLSRVFVMVAFPAGSNPQSAWGYSQLSWKEKLSRRRMTVVASPKSTKLCRLGLWETAWTSLQIEALSKNTCATPLPWNPVAFKEMDLCWRMKEEKLN
jgi:hypothetical protein